MLFSGAGFTPGGAVDLLLASQGKLASLSATADGAGAVEGAVAAPRAEQFLSRRQWRDTIGVTANDRTRIEANASPLESQFAATAFTLTRWGGFSPARYAAGKPATVEMSGWTFATGEPAWLVFRKGSRTVAKVALGTLDDECGDLRKRVRVPRKLKAGSYKVILTTDRRLRGPYTYRTGRVTKAGASAAALSRAARAMARADGGR
jgi:hypothetical protein